MTDDAKKRFKEKALRAAKAVTLSAAFVGATACADESKREPGWDVGTDVQADAADSESDGDTVTEDSGRVCSKEGADGTCPDDCTYNEDVDCCLETPNGEWSADSESCQFLVEGPLVPPEMRV